MDLGGWLRSLGLEQYEAAFRENAIDDTVLLSLTAEDLKDLGVGLVGHPRKLLDAIANLRAEGSAKAIRRSEEADSAADLAGLIGHNAECHAFSRQDFQYRNEGTASGCEQHRPRCSPVV